MATDVLEVAQTAQKQFLDGFEAVQEIVLEGARAVVEVVDKLVPVSLRQVEVPGAEMLVSPQQAMTLGFNFMESVLGSQRKFAEKLASLSGAVPG